MTEPGGIGEYCGIFVSNTQSISVDLSHVPFPLTICENLGKFFSTEGICGSRCMFGTGSLSSCIYSCCNSVSGWCLAGFENPLGRLLIIFLHSSGSPYPPALLLVLAGLRRP